MTAFRRPRLLATVLSAAASLGPVLSEAAPSTPPPYLIDIWETDHGLPENSATAMVQTPDGFLWFGTFNGLVRFDGVRFVVLDSSNTPELPSGAIVNLHLDRLDRLWISTDQGLVIVENGRWSRLGPEAGWVGDYVRTFAEGPAGEMVISTFDRHLLRFHGGRFTEIPSPVANDPLRRGGFPYIDPDGQLWLLHPEFIGRWSGRGWQSSTAFGATGLDWGGAGVARDGGLWIVRSDRVAKYRGGAVVVEVAITHPIRGFWGLHEDTSGTVWIASFEAGLYRYSPTDGWLHLTTANGLSYNAVRFAFEDREHNVWVGTSGGGLHRLKPRTFSTWGLGEGLPERVVKSVAEFPDSGRIVIGTHGAGVVDLNGTTVFAKTIGSTYVQSVYVDRHRQLWAGLFEDGLTRIDIGAAEAGEFFVPDAHGLWAVYAIFEDSKGRLWAGGDRGVSVSHDDKWTSFSLPRGRSVRAIAEQRSSGAMWIGTASGGLYRLANGRYEPVGAAEALQTTGVSALHEQTDGALLIGTFDKGLAVLAGQRLVMLGEAQGLAARGISAILDDGRGAVWLGTNHGVARIDRRDLSALIDGRQTIVNVRVYDRADGLVSGECPVGYQPTAIRDRHGRLWFATLKGVARVDPAALRVNTLPPPVRIDEVRLDDRPVPASTRALMAWGAASPVVIPPGSNRVEVHYTALSLTAPEKVRFQYRVDGLDTAWIDTGTRRVAYLQDLRPGAYVLRVKAANPDGVWSDGTATLAFTIQPFWWQTTWFWAVAMAGLFGGFGLIGWQGSRFAMRRQLERQAQARALEQERARLASVLDVTSDCVAFADPDGRLRYLNPAGRRILGFGVDTPLPPLTLADLHPPSAAQRLLNEAIPAAIRHGLWSGETTLVGPGGYDIPVSQVIAAHRSPRGEVEFLSTIVRDLTDRVRAEQQLLASEERLRQSQKMEAVGRLAGGIAHDFNNLLTVITGYTSLLLERHTPDDPHYLAIDETHKASERAAELTRQLLAFSRKQVLTLTALDLNAVIRNLEKMLRPLLGEQVELVTDLASDLGAVRGDRSQLEQVIVNLAVNARDAMPDGGRLTLTTANATVSAAEAAANPELVAGCYVRLTVTDTGAGMEPSVQQRVFEPFYTTKSEFGGTGLGLATVYGIVRQSGGCIDVDSEPGHGSTFSVYLPRDAGVPAEIPAAAPADSPGGGPEVVLLVEDESSVRSIARAALERCGYTVIEASHPAQALRLASTHSGPIDLLLTDVVMPDMNGRELAGQLLEQRPGLKVLYVSGYTDDAILRHGVLDAGVAFLQKPFTPNMLARKVREVLDADSR